MNNQQLHYLQAMNIPAWQLRETASEQPLEKKSCDLAQLAKKVSACTACPLYQSRQQTVFGVGNPKANVLIVGEAPGAQEDQKGEPFVGRAGALLNEILSAFDLHRNDVYIANILKCRPPNNRNPNKAEIEQCTPFLQAQINLIQPTVMVALGRVAAHHLLDTTESLSRLRGHIHHYGEQKTPLIATYHPAYLLRTPHDKRKAYLDWCFINKTLKMRFQD